MRVDGGGTARKLRCAAHLERQLCDMQLQMLNGRSWPVALISISANATDDMRPTVVD